MPLVFEFLALGGRRRRVTRLPLESESLSGPFGDEFRHVRESEESC